jgi:hypothetical protein
MLDTYFICKYVLIDLYMCMYKYGFMLYYAYHRRININRCKIKQQHVLLSRELYFISCIHMTPFDAKTDTIA